MQLAHDTKLAGCSSSASQKKIHIYIYKCMCIGMDIHMCTYIYICELIVHILEYEGSVLFEVCLKADIELHIGFLELEHGLHLLCNFIEKLFIRTLGLGCNFEVHL